MNVSYEKYFSLCKVLRYYLSHFKNIYYILVILQPPERGKLSVSCHESL